MSAVDGAGQLIFLALLIGIFYFMLIRPQRKRVDSHRRLMSSLDIGDDIVTIGGLHGTIVGLSDDDLELEVAPGTKLRFVKSSVARVVSEEDTELDEESEEDTESEDPEAIDRQGTVADPREERA